MNTLAYLIYFIITGFITIWVGRRFFRNGRLFILGLLRQDESLTDAINRILLIGYYLLNLGYAALMISTWETITTYTELLESITEMTARIILTLSLIHYCNMAGIYVISKRKNTFTHS
ncbi:hypothetical protein [Chitinophaga barathri]|uniref:Uncharacterized protein n=1 Tax=Chitinophaga barathri TaxID=1647451 RepID=A0A3N4MQD2_9BACT|nr:hypothetical protein [Chitinophaga barathri]RPD41879.1 hypothetical protein EG028_06875 [Chitinophaga barathri]